jgi:hypothetical protein
LLFREHVEPVHVGVVLLYGRRSSCKNPRFKWLSRARPTYRLSPPRRHCYRNFAKFFVAVAAEAFPALFAGLKTRQYRFIVIANAVRRFASTSICSDKTARYLLLADWRVIEYLEGRDAVRDEFLQYWGPKYPNCTQAIWDGRRRCWWESSPSADHAQTFSLQP